MQWFTFIYLTLYKNQHSLYIYIKSKGIYQPENLVSKFEYRSWRSVLHSTLCDKVCQWLAAGRWFFPDTAVSSINKFDCHDIAEILLKVALNTITPIFRNLQESGLFSGRFWYVLLYPYFLQIKKNANKIKNQTLWLSSRKLKKKLLSTILFWCNL
jgi:hypothetical protein